jgi:diacylglycerol kinase
MSFFQTVTGTKSGFSTNLKNQINLSILIVGAISLIVSLAWNSAITSLIDYYVPQKYANSKNAWYKVLYALILTIVIFAGVNFLIG